MVFSSLWSPALLFMHVPGVSESEGGASSWIPLGPLTFQPSEFAKLAVVVAGAHLLSIAEVAERSDFKLLHVAVRRGGALMCLLVLVEPDLGTAIIIAGLLLGLLWVGGMKVRHWILVGRHRGGGAPGLHLLEPGRMARVLSFLDPVGGSPRHQFPAVAVARGPGAGRMVRSGPGESIQKFSYLPKAHTDMIFAILGEEFGLVGAGLVILLFGVFAVACWRLARQCADPMGKYLIAGCGMLVTLQAVVNIGGVIGAMPLTGVPSRSSATAATV